MSRILATRRMRLYVLADTASNLGDFALFLAMAIWVKTISGSTSAAALVMFSFAAGSLLLPAAGLLTDRVRRRPLLIGANLALATVVLLLLLVNGADQIWLVYLVMFAYGALGSVTGPAQLALLPSLVPKDSLGDANGLIQSVRGLLRVFAPVIGAGLFAWLGPQAVILIDATLFVLAAVALLAVEVNEPKPTRSGEHWLTEISAGLRFIGRTVTLRQLVISCGLAMLVLGFFEAIGLAVVTSGLGHAPTFLGVLGIAQAIGTIVGGVTAGAVMRRTSEGMTVVVGLALVAVSSLLLMIQVTALVIAAMTLLGLCVPWLVVGATTALQRRTPESLLGRTSAAFEFAVTVPQTLSIAVGAALIALLDYRLLLGIVATAVTVSAVYLASRPAQRSRALDQSADVLIPTGSPVAVTPPKGS
ncbi:MFS transporter [Verrucosispora sp. WMMD573]|uniref:MFS transporter n=1 Tax=Verrucosispora sp. WMMD573 TaxID=3015149 RepID=UPI00248C32DF|nr:MFS transporter [Verrucosispora sp. WMMD573]WBB56639.1 MFS transporter [Verrucosispora sp. WMMD573]